MSDLLEVSRIQAGKLEMRPQPCALAAIVRDTVEDERLSHPTRTIQFDMATESLPAVVDADRIRQVVTNYLTNALKYAPADQPITVTVARDGEQGDLAWVAVRDQEPGLAAEQQARIWDRFHRTSGIEQQDGSSVGLGLGLYISREIVERHGGHVGVESEVGQGSTFWFTLPLDHELPHST
ncbi:MAG: HAMP domain-containing sensor histidine kinase [Ktedonobacterales bacterium]